MKLQVIKTIEQHKAALAAMDALMSFDKLPEEMSLWLETMAILVDEYETKHWPITAPKPIEAIKIRMEDKGLKQKDMVKYFGSKSKASEVLAGKRPLNLKMIRKLRDGLGIPAEILIK